jgi:hypothetical protein
MDDDTLVKEAFDAYRANPGGEVRLDMAAIATAGRRRNRRRAMVRGAVAGVAAMLVAGGVLFTQLSSGPADGPLRVATAPPGALPPATGRPATGLFFGAPGSQDGPIKSGGPARADATQFMANLDAQRPAYVDTGWQAGSDDPKPRVRWVLASWVDGDRAAEALLVIDRGPVYRAIYPPPYQVCTEFDTANGWSCSVTKIDGQGWLKVQKPPSSDLLFVSLQRSGAGGEDGALVALTISKGAATKAPLAHGRTELGRLPLDESAAKDLVLALG